MGQPHTSPHFVQFMNNDSRFQTAKRRRATGREPTAILPIVIFKRSIIRALIIKAHTLYDLALISSDDAAH